MAGLLKQAYSSWSFLSFPPNASASSSASREFFDRPSWYISTVTVLEDIATIAKTYKLDDDAQFTCNFRATFDPEKQAATTEPVPAFDAIDAEVVEE
jgi:hypothetical protein